MAWRLLNKPQDIREKIAKKGIKLETQKLTIDKVSSLFWCNFGRILYFWLGIIHPSEFEQNKNICNILSTKL